MTRVVLRLWLPDRPGALGQVASRIGAVRGDVVGIEILERGAGLVVDELLVDLPPDAGVELLAREVRQVDGVSVEEIREAGRGSADPGMRALDVASDLVAAPTDAAVFAVLADHARRDLAAAWAAVVATPDGAVLHASGDVPPEPWLLAFAGGAGHPRSEPAPRLVSGTGTFPMPESGLDYLLATPGRRLHAREVHRLARLASLADRCVARLAMCRAALAHPSTRAPSDGGRARLRPAAGPPGREPAPFGPPGRTART